eukprot:GHVP01052171.1.p1 GENE.GHVP01052171.1~~GHVP01052171.1.p1  ORF type:complete len:155 (+),score=19.14 GHVP01052171.1:19-483(+)
MSRFLVPASQIQAAASELLQCDFTKRESLEKTREAIIKFANNAAFACMKQCSKALNIYPNWDNFNTSMKTVRELQWVEAGSAPNCYLILVDDSIFDSINEVLTSMGNMNFQNMYAIFRFNAARAKFLRHASASIWNPTARQDRQIPPFRPSDQC